MKKYGEILNDSQIQKIISGNKSMASLTSSDSDIVIIPNSNSGRKRKINAITPSMEKTISKIDKRMNKKRKYKSLPL